MVSIKSSNTSAHQQRSTCYAFFTDQQTKVSSQFLDFSQHTNPELAAVLQKHPFAAKSLELVELPTLINGELALVIVVGLGKQKNEKPYDVEVLRRGVAKMVRAAQARKIDSMVIDAPAASLFGISSLELGNQMATICAMANYHFNDFLTDASRSHLISEITFTVNAADYAEFQKGVEEGTVIAYAVNKARHWIDLPPCVMTPPHLADKAQEIGAKTGLKTTVFYEPQINEMGMGGLSAVAAGSEVECRMAIMEYKAPIHGAPTLAFVGKGITFDSGGISIKPSQGMGDMKADMSGAAAVIAVMEAIAHFKPNVNVIGLVGVSENLPSGKATKPGDIVRFYNGKTAEIQNTDAEGRLVLADVMSYAVKHYKPDAMIDIATLTGACHYALGPFYTGLVSQHDELSEKVLKAAKKAGERTWRLPMDDDYKPANDTPVADLSNCGSGPYKAGWMSAAFFLQAFVDDTPWVHLDIAGTAFDIPDLPYYRRGGATGTAVRTLIELARTYEK